MATTAPVRTDAVPTAAYAHLEERILARDQMKDFQELADEAFSDLLSKHGGPGGISVDVGRGFSLFGSADEPIRERLKGIEVATLTPLEALNILDELKRMV